MSEVAEHENVFNRLSTQAEDSKIIHALSIDNVIFGIEEGCLHVLLVKQSDPRHSGRWALPGGWVKQNEDLRAAANRVLFELTGFDNLYLEQLRAFGKVDRFPNERVVTVSYYALVSTTQYPTIAVNSGTDSLWFSIDDLPELVYDHRDILHTALSHVRKEVRHRPIGFELLPKKFTLLELQSMYECLLDRTLDKGNFRRKILKTNMLIASEERQSGVRHRAATLYEFDPEVYDDLVNVGFSFVL